MELRIRQTALPASIEKEGKITSIPGGVLFTENRFLGTRCRNALDGAPGCRVAITWLPSIKVMTFWKGKK